MKYTSPLVASAIGTVTLLGTMPLAFAASSSSTTVDPAACRTALAQELSVISPAHDALMAAMKSAQTQRVTALQSALNLTDATARTTAIKAANEAFWTSTKSAHDTFETATKTAREQLQTACKGLGIAPGMGGMMQGDKMDHGRGKNGMKRQGKRGHMMQWQQMPGATK